ncbi:uncharacterized protein AMSG_01388 [Thecamonas trahens ATCC 50062]|uniref:BTB domain-containing protein n=1 Tax=Thecamonas trahens ATCC 50062 TaxID=461836 RepID=A0A0L0DMZ3_THETB|nr:hypothetical protein AMSG_01388 [Thecamonas trahens ATCC 50062]KNC53677.1 hypothetical protein AMSG_01388 [Thecamonas trahens ATCC 50062]|eukprot:XP_013761991.1 hypothetical protein AMSG_01388 [Thecamonas trahens ATCC 50062]
MADGSMPSIYELNMLALMTAAELADVTLLVDTDPFAEPDADGAALLDEFLAASKSEAEPATRIDGGNGGECDHAGGDNAIDELEASPTETATATTTADVVEIDAHAALLAAHSPVLRAIIVDERRAGVTTKILVPISGLAEAAVRAALTYMYTGRVTEMDAGWVVDFIEFGIRYQVPLLVELGELFVAEEVTVETAAVMWTAGLRFGNATVVERMAQFALDPSFSCAFLGHPSFASLPYQVVAALAADTALVVDELTVFSALAAWIAANLPGYPATLDTEAATQAAGLLEAVRYPLLSPDALADTVEPSGLVPAWLLAEAYRFHATGRSPSSSDSGSTLRFTPRAEPPPASPLTASPRM